jgi:branched-chain amino acid transport system permease protein
MEPQRRYTPIRKVIPALFAIFLLAVPLILTNPAYLQIVVFIFWYAYLTTSWNLVGGFAGVLPLGHTMFTGIGAYTSTLLFIQYGLTPWVGMFVGAVLAMLVGIFVGLPTFKMRGAYFALATIAFLEGLRVLTENTKTFLGFKVNGPQGMNLPLKGNSLYYFQFNSKVWYYYIILIMTAIVLYITYRVSRSRLGYYLTAGGEDKEAAEALGVNVARCKLYAMMLSTFFTALGGTFYAQLVRYIHPRGIMSLDLSFEIAFIAIVGGRGTVAGPILGSILLVPFAELTRLYLGGSFLGIHLVVYGILLMIVILFQPKGITEPLLRLYERLVARLEQRFVR